MAAMESAIDRVLAGPERKTRVMSDNEKRIIAYHEGGHTLVGHVLEGTDPIHKVSIVSRGRALGWTLALPTEDKYLKTRAELVDTMTMLLGGRTAEELVFGDPTTGASDDIERCTEIARAMVTTYGMSERARPAAARQQVGRGVPRQGLRPRGRLLRRGGGAHRRRGAPARRPRPRPGAVHPHHPPGHARPAGRRRSIEKETLDDADLAEVFGDIDKGAGIDVPHGRARALGAAAHPPRAAGSTCGWPRPRRSPTPTSARALAAGTSLWRRVQRWRQLRAPRPSGT